MAASAVWPRRLRTAPASAVSIGDGTTAMPRAPMPVAPTDLDDDVVQDTTPVSVKRCSDVVKNTPLPVAAQWPSRTMAPNLFEGSGSDPSAQKVCIDLEQEGPVRRSTFAVPSAGNSFSSPPWLRPVQEPVPAAAASTAPLKPSSDGELEGKDDHAMVRIRSSAICKGQPHPTVLCEPPAIAAVQLPKLSADLEIRIPAKVAHGALSSMQIETVAYASHRFQRKLPCGSRCGYLLGDGTGCGKGRCIAALILDQWNRGNRRCVWLSVSADLFEDAIRDMRDVGAGTLPFCALSSVPAGRDLDAGSNPALDAFGPSGDGVLFVTYSLLVSGYGKGRSRFSQLVAWLRGRNARGGGLLVFDEAHRAKNLLGGRDEGFGGRPATVGTKTGLLVEKLQRVCPDCAVLYASATSATDVKHLAYMTRLGFWGKGHSSFSDFNAFQQRLSRGGVAAMEIMAVQMRSAGMLSCRSLSFEGATFETFLVPLSADMEKRYDAACLLWRDVLDALRRARDDTQLKLGVQPGRLLWAAQQIFFKALLVAAKVEEAVRRAEKALCAGEAVVICLWSTHAARSHDQMSGHTVGDRVDSWLSGPRMVLQHFLERHFPVRDRAGQEVPWAREAFSDFLGRLNSLSLPPNPLDDLIARLGGPNQVAEMTGRTHRLVSCDDGTTRWESRHSATYGIGGLESVNIKEQRSFQHGLKRVAIISEAASSGISLHCSRQLTALGVPVRRRCMISIELPWAADKALQQFGRVHRSNQEVPPRFVFLVTQLPSEQRFVSAVRHRLRLLGAVTRGDHRAPLDGGGIDGSQDLHGEHGRRALDVLLKDLSDGAIVSSVPYKDSMKTLSKWSGQWSKFAADARAELDSVEIDLPPSEGSQSISSDGQIMNRFLNRLLMVTCVMQCAIFDALLAALTFVRGDDLAVDGLQPLVRRDFARSVVCTAHEPLKRKDLDLRFTRLRIDRGLSWEDALAHCQRVRPPEGFYFRRRSAAVPDPVLVLRRVAGRVACAQSFHLYCPHMASTSLQHKSISEESLLSTSTKEGVFEYCPLTSGAAVERFGRLWRAAFDLSGKPCLFGGIGRCRPACSNCVRFKTESILNGEGLISAWQEVEQLLGGNALAVARVRTDCGTSVAGVRVPEIYVNRLRVALEAGTQAPQQEAKTVAAIAAAGDGIPNKRAERRTRNDPKSRRSSVLRQGGASFQRTPPWLGRARPVQTLEISDDECRQSAGSDQGLYSGGHPRKRRRVSSEEVLLHRRRLRCTPSAGSAARSVPPSVITLADDEPSAHVVSVGMRNQASVTKTPVVVI